MSRTCWLLPAILLGVFLIEDGSALAQSGKPTEQSHYSGQRLWVVVKGDLNDFTDKGDTVQADFDTEREAQADAKQRNDILTGSDKYKYLFTYRKHTTGDPTVSSDRGIPGKGITLPKTKVIDPGPLKKAPSLAGKKGQGRIGNFKVTMEFGANGELVISGELQGNGKWSQTDSGGVTMETDASKFRGNINGEQLAGVRFSKNNSQPLAEWSVALEADLQTPEATTVQPAVDDVVGRWEFDNGNGHIGPTRVVIYADGKADSGKNYQGITFHVGTWRRVSSKEIEINMQFVDPHDGTIYNGEPESFSLILTGDERAYLKDLPQHKFIRTGQTQVATWKIDRYEKHRHIW